jgi:hypothetical protein
MKTTLSMMKNVAIICLTAAVLFLLYRESPHPSKNQEVDLRIYNEQNRSFDEDRGLDPGFEMSDVSSSLTIL